MAKRFIWLFESNSNTLGPADYSAGDAIASNSNVTFGGSAAKVGAFGAIATASVATSLSFAADILKNAGAIDTAEGACGFWWLAETTFPGNGLVNGLRVYAGPVANGFRLQSITGSKLQLYAQNPLTQVATAAPTVTLAADTWYFLVVRWDVPGNRMKFEIYVDAGGNTLAAAGTGSTWYAENTTDVAGVLNSTDFGASVFDQVQFAVKAASTAVRTFTDNVIMSDLYAAPIQNNAFITDEANYAEANKKLKISIRPTAAGASGVQGVVFSAPAGSNMTGTTRYGEFADKTFEAVTEGTGIAERAVLKVPVTDFGGSALAVDDVVAVCVRSPAANLTTGIFPGVIIEE